jgi:hypothetical protein
MTMADTTRAVQPLASSRRKLLSAAAAAASAAALGALPARAEGEADRRFFSAFPPFYEPYFGYGTRETLREEMVPGRIWGFVQEQVRAHAGEALPATRVCVCGAVCSICLSPRR